MKPTKLHFSLAAIAITMLATGAPLSGSETDDRIETSFKNSYVSKTYLKDDAVKTAAKDGVVTLTGTVADESHKTLAEETAAGLPGVTRVDNKLVTEGEAATKGADIWISQKARLALMFHRNVDSGKTVITVKDGVVTLKGTASSIAQKELTGEYAKDIDGVKEVKNDMTVAATPEITERTAAEILDDASISAQVRMALSTHRSTSSVRTKVESRSGEVTLTGIAKNEAEKTLVTKLVTDIQGVTSVKNLMTIDTPKTK